ncbi:hypothetical protein PLICRDRAFT_45769 [Plicaturopsis crispa FD-325 SS-3]|uniref:DUF6534 domain-containing protein n=1 Tax=Plicaturopsis crispa FD-325 SS-3 TaxID=944288 RepID=A0A0C9SL61_PLICR|nr:hypothetical protein PLICRDRAFT_45769 [Plicaturopsis crispa FD-325 SS-3]
MASALSREQLNELLGPVFVGSVLNWGLLGTLTVQVYIYSTASTKDRLAFKILVYGVYILDLVQTVLAAHASWALLVAGWGNPLVLVFSPWSVATIPIMSGIISAIVQLYFAWRIWKLGKTIIMRAIVILITLLALMQCTSAFYASVLFAVDPQRSELRKVENGFTVWLAGSFAVDVLIAGSMMMILREVRVKSPFKATDTLITRLMVHTVQTGLVTAVTAGIELILFLVYPNNNFHGAAAYILAKLYSNVLLATFNARTRMQRSETSGNSSSMGNGYSGRAAVDKYPMVDRSASRRDPALGRGTDVVHIATEVQVTLDEDQTVGRPSDDPEAYREGSKAYPV